MKVYVNASFSGHYVGAAAVVVAASKEAAAEALEKRLTEIGLRQHVPTEDMTHVNTRKESVDILLDGDY